MFLVLTSLVFPLGVNYNIQMMEWGSERESIAEDFAEKAQRASEYMISSRASRRVREEGDEAN